MELGLQAMPCLFVTDVDFLVTFDLALSILLYYSQRNEGKTFKTAPVFLLVSFSLSHYLIKLIGLAREGDTSRGL